MRSIVVGGMGFLGGAVVDALLERGDTVGIVDNRGTRRERDRRFGATRVRGWHGDILDQATLAPAFAGADEIYHFAGRLGTSELEEDIHGAIAANITGAVNVFEAAIAAGVTVVFYPSKPNVWLNVYTITKAASEDLARLYAANHSLRIRSLRYFNAYGPWQATGPIRKIIPTFAQQALRGEPLTIYGDGQQTVDMIHAEDIGRITVDYTRAHADDQALDCGRSSRRRARCHGGCSVETICSGRGGAMGPRISTTVDDDD